MAHRDEPAPATPDRDGVPTRRDRIRLAADVVRQLAAAVGSYRLFPDDPLQAGFRAAVARAQDAATAALTAGAVHVDIRSGRFVIGDDELPADATLARFARACFERHVEHLHVRAAPQTAELVALGEVLSLPIEEVLARGGAQRGLLDRGVSSIAVGEVLPEATDDAQPTDDAKPTDDAQPTPAPLDAAAAAAAAPAPARAEPEFRELELPAGLVDDADARYLRELYPGTDDDARTLTMLALRDYLLAERRPDALDRVLARWSDAVRDAAASGDGDTVDRLLAIVDGLTDEHADAVRRALGAVPTPELIRDLLPTAPASAAPADIAALLRRFGGAAQGVVLDLLAAEEDRSARSQLVAVAVELAGDDLAPIAARLDDPRWYVVRNLVTILGRSGGPAAVPVLAGVLGHPDATVRRAVVASLVRCAGTRAVPYLRRPMGDRDPSVRAATLTALVGLRADAAARALADVAANGVHLDDRRRALEALATHPSDAADELLAGLASRRDTPKLPRVLRSQARRLARTTTRGSR
jgi:HEAT repeat protein